MSFFDDASLAFLPSGGAGKDGKAYSIKPTDGTGDFTFSRGSNLTATRVGPTGLIEKGRENLFTYSNDFTQWTKLNTTTTSGQSGYDGSSDATEVSFTAGSSRAIGKGGLQTSVVNFSVYVKAGTHDIIQFTPSNSASTFANFDISASNPATGNTGGLVLHSSITSVGNGWYRCSAVLNNTGTGTMWIWIVDSLTSGRAASVSTDGTFFVQDAQLEVGLAATDYIESGASTGKAGLLENEPRFDYSGGATCPSLLLEPQRVNLVPYSEYIEGSGWTALNGITLDANNTTSPEGITNAYEVTATSISHNIFFDKAVSVSTDYTLSFYAKRGSMTDMNYAIYDSTNGSFIVSETSYYSSTSNEWARIKLNFTTPSNCVNIRVFPLRNSGVTGNVYLWGFQLEAGSYPTSYIPNHSGGSATRTGDITDRGANLSYTGNYTLFMEFELTQDAAYLLNSNTSTAYSLFIENDDCYFFFGRTGGDSGFVQFVNKFNWSANLGTNIKMAFYKNGTSSKMFVNGTEYTPSSNTLSTGNEVLDWRYLNYSTTADRQEQAYIKQLLEFEEALSDADCITLTT